MRRRHLFILSSRSPLAARARLKVAGRLPLLELAAVNGENAPGGHYTTVGSSPERATAYYVIRYQRKPGQTI